MLRYALSGSFVLAPLVLASLAPAPAPQTTTCTNFWLHEPVVTYDVAGSTLIGPIYRHLAVYNDGHMILSATTYDPDPGHAATSFLTAAEVTQLRQDLSNAGVWTLCDEQLGGSDIPLTTVTMFRGTSAAITRTFSYWFAQAPYDGVDQVIQNLIAAKFPNF